MKHDITYLICLFHAQNLWRRWMLAHNVPRPGGKLPGLAMILAILAVVLVGLNLVWGVQLEIGRVLAFLAALALGVRPFSWQRCPRDQVGPTSPPPPRSR